MRKVIKKLICILLIVFISINALFPNRIYAADILGNFMITTADGFLGLLSWPIRLVFGVFGMLFQGALCAVDLISDFDYDGMLTLEKLFFNKVPITNINIFQATEVKEPVKTIRQSIADFYMAFRNLAIVLSLVVLIYIGIQMALNSTAGKQAKYKQMLTNWVVGFGLIFLLHYIIIITINANEMLVTALRDSLKSTIGMKNLLGNLVAIFITTPSLLKAFSALIMYLLLTIFTLIFYIIYIKRMITISFLITIAPLISITYSIDKIDNNRSEILNSWFREFMYNVLIQPFHCIIYMAFIGIAYELITYDPDILSFAEGFGDWGSMVLAIIFTCSIFLCEKIVKEIFGFSKSKTLLEKAAIVTTVVNVATTAKNFVAIKGAKNDQAAQKRIDALPTMPDGKKATADRLVKARDAAEKTRVAGGTPPPPPSPSPSSSPSPSPSPAPSPGQTSWLHNLIDKGKKNYPTMLRYATVILPTIDAIKAKRHEDRWRHMTTEDYFIAAGQLYREEIGKTGTVMTDADLAREMQYLYAKADYTGLTKPQIDYKDYIEQLKPQYSATELEDLILHGTRDNERWGK